MQSAGMRMPKKSELEAKFRDIHHLRNMKFSSEDIQYKLSRQNKYAGRLAQSTVNSAPKPKTSAQIMQERLEEINRANRRRNQEEGRAAMIAERKKEMQRRAQAAKERERKEKEAADKAARDAERKAHLAVLGKDDLFDGSDVSRGGTPGISRSGTPLPKREVKGIPTFTKKKMDDDVIASLDLDIDIEI
jgi:RNA polymerase-associated protein RTF1